MVFDVKYDLIYKARLVVVGNWTVNDKDDLYSGVVRMDSIITFLSKENCMDFHVTHVTSETPFYKEKQKRKSI
jgi:hypothetical protein